MTIRLVNEDCLTALPRLAAEGLQAHACITDPPYHLTSIVKRFGGEKAAPAKHGTDGAYARASRGFMGKTWDGGDIALRPETWRLVYDCLRPGAYLMAFGGTRTWHRQAVAIEDAGFEIRDTIMWLYGSGFPKSHDVSKGIDRARVEDIGPIRVVCRAIRSSMDDAGLKSGDLTSLFGDCHSRLIDHWAARDTDSQPSLPTWPQWEILRDRLALHDLDGEVWRLNGRKGKPGDTWSNAEVIGEHEGVPGGFGDHRFTVADASIRAPSPEASQWLGWGTALKPAVEPIILARKPLIGTVAANVLRFGTGAINIDASRIHAPDAQGGDYTVKRLKPGATLDKTGGSWRPEDGPEYHGTMKPGRWPANVIHDGSEEVEAAFAAFGEAPGQIAPLSTGSSPKTSNVYGKMSREGEASANRRYTENGSTNFAAMPGERRGDSGTASRFFYTAKADAADRAGSKHPTVKPTDLMRYLVQMVTPKGGTVLDPFAGSGSTGLAADQLGCDAVLIERDPGYAEDIERKITGDCPLFTKVSA